MKLKGRESRLELYSSSPYISPIASVTWWLLSLIDRVLPCLLPPKLPPPISRGRVEAWSGRASLISTKIVV